MGIALWPAEPWTAIVKRRIFWISFLILALAVLLGAWLSTHLVQMPVDEWTPPGKEARLNPYLALERFMTAMGRPLIRGSAASLDELPPGGVLLLDSHRRAQLSVARRTRLLAWVEQGGYLIVSPEGPGVEDPLLAFFKVNCNCQAEDEKPQAAGSGGNKAAPPESISVSIPGAARPLAADFFYTRLRAGDIPPEWRAGAPKQSDQILHFRHGAGQVTMVGSLNNFFDNQHISHRDHAELLWTLLRNYQPDPARPVILITRLGGVTLWQWLGETAWTATLSGAALIALWLWAVIPRFGPIRPEPPPGRRELREHLTAIGRYVWRVGGLAHWLEIARESCRARLALRHPGLLALPPEEQARALADLTHHPASLIAAALHQPALSPQSFTLALRTLRNLERTL